MPGVVSSVSSGSAEFDGLRTAVASDPQLRTEIEWLMNLTVDTYNVSDRGMRFIVGSIGEWLSAFVAYSAGVLTLPEGHNADGHDLVGLIERNRAMWSVKSSYSPRVKTFILTNGRGGSGRGFVDKTIFWAPSLPGIVFADPEIHVELAKAQRVEEDAVTLSKAAVLDHAQAHPECVVEVSVPSNPGTAKNDPGFEAVKLLVQSGPFRRLTKMLEDAEAAPAATVLEQIKELQRLHAEGILDRNQLQAALNQVTGSSGSYPAN